MVRSGAPAHEEWAWRIHPFAGRNEGILHAAIVSRDGRSIACTTRLNAVTTDHLAAITARIVSFAHIAARCLGGDAAEQAIVELFGGSLLCIVVLAHGAHLAVLTTAADRERLAFDVYRLVEQLRDPAT